MLDGAKGHRGHFVPQGEGYPSLGMRSTWDCMRRSGRTVNWSCWSNSSLWPAQAAADAALLEESRSMELRLVRPQPQPYLAESE